VAVLGFSKKIKAFFGLREPISDEFFDSLMDLLVEGDFGAPEAYQTVETLRTVCRKEKIETPEGVRNRLAILLQSYFLGLPEVNVESPGFTVLLLLGVNGVGKTTTAAKLAHRFQEKYGRSAILAAADTFRAAAIDQLKIHGQRLGCRVVAHKSGGDPAAVLFDSLEAAQAGGIDLVIADTAGRMHTKSALVEELKKIDRIVGTKAPGATYRKLLVLDGTTGRNALLQAQTFQSSVPLDGVILTKYDSIARGGVVFSLAQSLKLPILYVCDGEAYQNILPFSGPDYVRDFLDL